MHVEVDSPSTDKFYNSYTEIGNTNYLELLACDIMCDCSHDGFSVETENGNHNLRIHQNVVIYFLLSFLLFTVTQYLCISM